MTFAETSRLLRKLVVINMVNTLAYRGDFVMYMLGAILSPVISLLVWRAAIASGAALPVDNTYLTTYFVLLSIVSVLTSSWLSGFLAGTIRNGELSTWLARPGSFLYGPVANNVSEKCFKLTVLLPMVVLFGWFFRDDIDLAAPAWRWVVMGVSILLGAMLFFSLDVIEGSLAFWMEDISGLITARALILGVLAGMVVPLALLPEWIQGFMVLQPFRYLASFPLEIIVSDLSGRDIALGFAIQLAWTIGLVVLARWIWGRGKRAYSAVGA